MSRDVRSRLDRRASKANLFLPEALKTTLVSYYELLERWNRKINLTALTDADEAIDRLLLEPVAAARLIDSPAGQDLLDVGSGGGSPAIPLALGLGPTTRLTMVEVKVRKSAFLREALRHLGLSGASVETSRFEELLSLPGMLERFDLVSIRAVRVESRVLMTLQAFLKPGGRVLLFRGPSGAAQPGNVIHPLEWDSTHQLLESLQSRLTILRKRSSGVGVPRGTLRGPDVER